MRCIRGGGKAGICCSLNYLKRIDQKQTVLQHLSYLNKAQMCAVLLPLQLGLQDSSCCAYPWATQEPQPTNGNRGAYRQLPLGNSDCTTSVFLPLSTSEATSAHVSFLFDSRHDE